MTTTTTMEYEVRQTGKTRWIVVDGTGTRISKHSSANDAQKAAGVYAKTVLTVSDEQENIRLLRCAYYRSFK